MPSYLDAVGLTFLWSKISMEDYPNNEVLVAILNAVDKTKIENTGNNVAHNNMPPYLAVYIWKRTE